jgi:hypothetical protein
MTARRITVLLAALALALGAGCGEDDEPSQQPAEGTPSTVETGPSTLGSTGTQPTVTEQSDRGY